MPYTTDVFLSWPSFESWDALRGWLTSAEGGTLRVVEPRESPYALVRYVKGQSNFDLPHVAWCRSVVVEKSTRLPVSVAPPKASLLSDSSSSDAIVAEEFLDGTMMNLFDAGTQSSVYIATRSRLNADTKFYDGGPTFASMLNDALTEQGVQSLSDLLPSEAKTNEYKSFTSLILQHPANRIVHTIPKASFTILHQGFVSQTGLVSIEEDSYKFRYVSSSDVISCTTSRYNLDQIRAAKTVQTWVSDQSQKIGFGWQGLVMKDGQGRRWRVRSEVYETVRKIRGNESTNEERFARLRKNRCVDQYLAFFNEDRDTMYELEGRFRKNTKQLFQFYADVFRARSSQYHTLPWPYKHHVSVLHTQYKDVLRAQGKKVDLNEVIRYTNGLSLEDTVNMSKVHSLVPSKPKVVEPTAATAVIPEAPADEVSA
jgi:hypothetical protein